MCPLDSLCNKGRFYQWTSLPMDVFTNGRFHQWTFLPMDVFTNGRFHQWTFLPMDVFTNGRFYQWTFLPMDVTGNNVTAIAKQRAFSRPRPQQDVLDQETPY